MKKKKIKLIIDISEEAYRARQHWISNPKRMLNEVDIAIANGKPITNDQNIMDDEQCIGYLENIRDMFIIGKGNCEGQALEYQQRFISAIEYAIAKMKGGAE